MSRLILKDILLSKKMLPLVALYGIFMIFAFNRSAEFGDTGYIGGVVAVAYIMISRAAAYDDINKSEMMLLSLPLPRWRIVLAKYLSVIVYSVIGTLSYFFGVFIVKALQLSFNTTTLSMEAIVGMIISLSIITSVYFPVYFKYGYMKSKFVIFILFFVGFFFIPIIFGKIVSNNLTWLNSLYEQINQLPDMFVGLILLGIFLIISIISYFISLRFYTKREF